MTLSETMLRLAPGGRAYLGEGIGDVARYVRGRLHAGGGFLGRGGAPDLYYTVFGIDCFHAVGCELASDATALFLSSFGNGETLDFMHLCCLARCWARVRPGGVDPAVRDRLAERIESFRTPDGGYNAAPGCGHGSMYGCFLAYAARQDLGLPHAEPDRLADSIAALEMEDGYFANERDIDLATTNASVGAVLLLRELGRDVDAKTLDWIAAQAHEVGGFLAGPAAPLPDLVSTATALFALAREGVDLDPLRQSCVDFVESLWQEDGGFCGQWLDETPDCEYTFYGLLSLGCLAEGA